MRPRLEIIGVSISITAQAKRRVYFLDVIREGPNGLTVRDNIASGTQNDCERTRDAIQRGAIPEWKHVFG